MRNRIAALSIILLLGFRAFSQQGPPIADHHQHLGSPEIVKLAATSTRPPVPISAKDVVALLDAAGIQRALVFSAAYVYGSPARTVEETRPRRGRIQ
jgi:hypothetical protein